MPHQQSNTPFSLAPVMADLARMFRDGAMKAYAAKLAQFKLGTKRSKPGSLVCGKTHRGQARRC
jgi:hypothetical protein